MPLYSDHISNMYYSGSSSYTSSPYSYSSAASPYGSSYSASYLNPGGSYSSHSSLGGYSRAPLSSRWLTSGGRAYSPMLSTISEKGTSSPVRINSPRRIPTSGRSYVSSPYTLRPININTADIDVSRDKYRTKLQSSNSSVPTGLPPRRESPLINKEKGHDKPDTGIDTSPGPQRSTIKRDRTVVRLHTVKRKERDSPRKPVEVLNNTTNNELTNTEVLEKQTESKKWREKLADDLAFKTQKEKKTLGAMLVEKFTLKEKTDNEYDNYTKMSPKTHVDDDKSSININNDELIIFPNKTVDRRCSVELLAEQASLLDSLIRRENLSTAPLDLSKVGADDDLTTDIKLETDDTTKRILTPQENRLTTTKSDHSLHDRLSSRDNNDPVFPKRRSLRKCSSGGNIRKLDCIKEISKKAKALNLPPVDEKLDKSKNFKRKITSTVEVTSPTPQLKFFVENVTVEEKSWPYKKDIIFSSTVDEKPLNEISTEIEGQRKSIKSKKELKQVDVDIPVNSDLKENDPSIAKDKNLKNSDVQITKGHRKSIKLKVKDKIKPQLNNSGNLASPEPEDGNFWEKIGKRETIYLIKRKQNLEDAKEQSKRSLFWFPEEEINNNIENNEIKAATLLEEVNDAHSEEKTNVRNKNIVRSISKEENKNLNECQNDFEEKTNININDNYNEFSNTSVIKDLSDPVIVEDTVSSHVESKENILEVEKILTTPDLTTSINSISKTSEKEKQIELTGDIVKSKMISDNRESIANDTKSIKKSSDGKKSNISEQNKSSNEENSIKKQNISLPQAKLSHLKESSYTNNRKEFKNILTTQLNVTEDSINTIKLETTEHTDENQESKHISNDEIKKTASISIENNVEPIIINSVVNAPENINIPDTKTTESSINKSSKKTITEINADEPDVESTFSVSPKETSVIIENIEKNIESLKEKNVEPAITDASIEIINIKDNKIQHEERCTNIEEDKTSYTRENNSKTSETKSNTKKTDKLVPSTDVLKLFTNMHPVKEEKALKPLIATPRPLQKRNAQTIRSSSSSESSDDDSSDEDTEEDGNEDAGQSGSSQGSAEYLECENNPDGRISTGSADSGFDSSAPTSPSGFQHAKKDCDVNCHRKCEKLTANLCGVNQRLLVEALASRSTSKTGGDSPSTSAGVTPPQTFTHDVLEQELELSTAYDLFRKTGRFTPPARTIPRFRKYTIEDFQFIRVLGKGSFGKVMLAELRDTEYYYAVKCLKKDVVLEDDDVECTLIERKVLALGTNHPYLCHLFATFQTDSHLFFVMEYLNGGDLMFHIQQSGRFPEVRARFYAAEIVSGLKFLHKRGIVYRDLKLDNILLDFDGHVRIADFGMCKLQIYLDKTADTFCGTPDYMAPEIIKGLKYNQTVDWWSFGVLLYEMLIGQSPFSGCDEDELFWSICNEMPSYPRFLTPDSLTILTRLLDKDARTRLGSPECMHGDIRDQKFFEPIHWDKLERRELEAPFKPRVRHPMDTQYFDRAFTGERPRLTAVEPQVLRSMDQEPFRGFSYTNPNATDR